MVIDLHNRTTVFELAPAAVRTATANGTGVDIQGYREVLKIMLNVGTVTGTTPTLNVKIQDSEDNSTYADVTGLAFAQVTAAGNWSIGVNTRAVRSHIRVVMTIAGSTPSFPCTILAVGQRA